LAKPERVLITGGAGFIGSHLTDRLLAEGREVTSLDAFDDFYDPTIKRRNLRSALKSPRFTLVEGDIRDEKKVGDLLSGRKPQVVVHLAAQPGVRLSIEKPVLTQDINVRGTSVILEACRRAQIDRFVFASSSSVYGNNEKVPFHENDRVDHPISPYAATKKAGELIGHTYHHVYGMHFWGLRFFTVFGPRQRPDMAIHKFTRLIDRGETVPQFGDGSSRRDYTFIDDIADALVACVDKAEGYQVLNLGESRTTTLAELVELIGAALGKKPNVKIFPFQAGDVKQTWADVSRARELIGYRPRFPVPEGIRLFIDWYRNEGTEA
jgi:UDP-glucuronate 4-epimerase